jgi:hypothetical protein
MLEANGLLPLLERTRRVCDFEGSQPANGSADVLIRRKMQFVLVDQ